MHNDDDTRQPPLPDVTMGGAAPGSRDCEPLLLPWRRLSHRLAPLIGDSGFCALHGRAIRLIRSDHDWLRSAGSARTIAQLIALLGERYAAVEASAAGAANEALLNTFNQLLATLVGEALTARLLDSAADGGPMNAQEHKQ